MVSVPFSRPKKKSVAALPYTSVIRPSAMLPSGSSRTVNCASTAAKSAVSAAARPVMSACGGAELPLMSAFQIRYSAAVTESPAVLRAVSSARKPVTGGSTGGVAAMSSGAKGSSPVTERSSSNSRTDSPKACASQPCRKSTLTVSRVSGVLAS